MHPELRNSQVTGEGVGLNIVAPCPITVSIANASSLCVTTPVSLSGKVDYSSLPWIYRRLQLRSVWDRTNSLLVNALTSILDPQSITTIRSRTHSGSDDIKLEMVANPNVDMGQSWPCGPEPYEASMTADAATQMDGKYGVGHDLGDASGVCADVDPIVPIPVQLQDEQGSTEPTVGPIFMIDLSYFRSVVGKPPKQDQIFSNVVNPFQKSNFSILGQESTLACAFFKHESRSSIAWKISLCHPLWGKAIFRGDVPDDHAKIRTSTKKFLFSLFDRCFVASGIFPCYKDPDKMDVNFIEFWTMIFPGDLATGRD